MLVDGEHAFWCAVDASILHGSGCETIRVSGGKLRRHYRYGPDSHASWSRMHGMRLLSRYASWCAERYHAVVRPVCDRTDGL
jgi:hypothetical protein